MSKPEKTLTLAGYTANIYRDPNPENDNPRENNESLGTLCLCPHPDNRCHVPGDKDAPKFDSVEEMAAYIHNIHAVHLPVYVWADWIPIVSTTGPGKHLGYIFCPLPKVHEEYGQGIHVTNTALEYMQGEVDEYAAFIAGEVYYYEIVAPDGTQVHGDGMAGLIGMDTAEEEAQMALSAAVANGDKVPEAA